MTLNLDFSFLKSREWLMLNQLHICITFHILYSFKTQDPSFFQHPDKLISNWIGREMEFEPSKDILSWITTVQNKFVLGVLKDEILLPIVVPSHLDVMQGGLSSSTGNSDGQCPSSCWMRPTLRPPKWIQMIHGNLVLVSSASHWIARTSQDTNI